MITSEIDRREESLKPGAASVEEAGAGRSPDRPAYRPLRWLIAALVGAVLVAFIWAVNVEPLSLGSGAYGVLAHDSDLTAVEVPGAGSSYLVRYGEGETATIMFPVTNTSLVPVRVVQPVPAEGNPSCGWQAEQTRMRRTGDDGWQPFEPTLLSRAEGIELAITGAFKCARTPAVFDGLATMDTFPVQYHVAGVIPRSSSFEPGFRFHWTTADIDVFTDDLVRTIGPTSTEWLDGR